MAQKQHGTTKSITPNTKAIKASNAKYIKALESGLYDKEISFFDKNTGGYLLYSKNRKMDNMEYNAATFMTMKGKQITMTPEGVEGYELIVSNGKAKYGDGRIGITSYEQRSPKAANEATARKTVENAINHARKRVLLLPYYLIIAVHSRCKKSNTEQNTMRGITLKQSISP